MGIKSILGGVAILGGGVWCHGPFNTGKGVGKLWVEFIILRRGVEFFSDLEREVEFFSCLTSKHF